MRRPVPSEAGPIKWGYCGTRTASALVENLNRSEAVMKRNPKLTLAEQRIRFIETARELGITDTDAVPKRAHSKVGMSKPKKPKRKK